MAHFEMKCGVFQNVVQQALYDILINGDDISAETKDIKEQLEITLGELIEKINGI